MRVTRLITILLLNALGVVLFLSWYLPPEHGFWFGVDKSIFFGFNSQMVTHPLFALIVAITNYRGFDAVSLLAMVCFTCRSGGAKRLRRSAGCWQSASPCC